MPLYEYQCDACGARFERIQKFSDALASECPTCGGSVRRLISSPAIQFKGSGFYITDYAKSGSGSGKEKSESASTKDTAKAPASSTESSKASDSSTSSEPAKPAAPPKSGDKAS